MLEPTKVPQHALPNFSVKFSKHGLFFVPVHGMAQLMYFLSLAGWAQIYSGISQPGLVGRVFFNSSCCMFCFFTQILSQPNLVPPLVRAPHTNTFPAPAQRPPVALASQMPPPLTTGLVSHARLPHVARGPCGSLSGVRGNQAQAALKAEQDMKVSTVVTASRAKLCL